MAKFVLPAVLAQHERNFHLISDKLKSFESIFTAKHKVWISKPLEKSSSSSRLLPEVYNFLKRILEIINSFLTLFRELYDFLFTRRTFQLQLSVSTIPSLINDSTFSFEKRLSTVNNVNSPKPLFSWIQRLTSKAISGVKNILWDNESHKFLYRQGLKKKALHDNLQILQYR